MSRPHPRDEVEARRGHCDVGGACGAAPAGTGGRAEHVHHGVAQHRTGLQVEGDQLLAPRCPQRHAAGQGGDAPVLRPEGVRLRYGGGRVAAPEGDGAADLQQDVAAPGAVRRRAACQLLALSLRFGTGTTPSAEARGALSAPMD